MFELKAHVFLDSHYLSISKLSCIIIVYSKVKENELLFAFPSYVLVVILVPYLKQKLLCSKLSKGIGHNSYGEPAWPNDIFYIFPIVILAIPSVFLGLAIHQPYKTSEHANPFATPFF